ncbi:MAG TPA: hypothetical protein VEA63_00685, partial [Opitutus sp.]|nr:hypothetical protein [Opitutus sp.]
TLDCAATFRQSPGLPVVRILKIVLSILVAIAAVIGGLFTVAVVVVASLAVLLTRRFLARTRPRVSTPSAPAQVRRTPARAPDAIEITATEVPNEENTASREKTPAP